jgi:hypothetical protein
VFCLESDTVLYAVWSKNASISIKHFGDSSVKIDYKASVTYRAVIDGNPDGAVISWYIDGKPVNGGETCKVSKATQNYTVEVKLIKGGADIATSGVKTVNVKSGFFARVVAFFREIFRRLPDYEL